RPRWDCRLRRCRWRRVSQCRRRKACSRRTCISLRKRRPRAERARSPSRFRWSRCRCRCCSSRRRFRTRVKEARTRQGRRQSAESREKSKLTACRFLFEVTTRWHRSCFAAYGRQSVASTGIAPRSLPMRIRADAFVSIRKIPETWIGIAKPRTMHPGGIVARTHTTRGIGLELSQLSEGEQGELYVVGLEGSLSRITAAGAPMPTCTYSIAPTNQIIATEGGSGNIGLATADGCVWTAVSNASWIYAAAPG